MYVSASQLDLFSSCGEAYRRKYIENDRRPPSLHAVVGSSVHKCAEANFKQKIETKMDLPASTIIEIAAAEYEAQVALEDVLLTKSEREEGARNVIGRGKDAVVALAELHAQSQAPDYQPVAVEQEMRLALSDSVMLLGYADLITDKGEVIDFKTSSRSKQQQDADKSTQLTIYSAAYEAVNGKPPTSMAIDVLVNTKQPKRQVIRTSRTTEDYDAMSHRLSAMLDALDKGVFLPANPMHWMCSESYCPYYEDCKYVKGKKQ